MLEWSRGGASGEYREEDIKDRKPCNWAANIPRTRALSSCEAETGEARDTFLYIARVREFCADARPTVEV